MIVEVFAPKMCYLKKPFPYSLNRGVIIHLLISDRLSIYFLVFARRDVLIWGYSECQHDSYSCSPVNILASVS